MDEGQFRSQDPRNSVPTAYQSGTHAQNVDDRRPPAESDWVREFLRLDIIKGGDHIMKFDGTNPEKFSTWYEEFECNMVAAGLNRYPREVIIALRRHTDKRPRKFFLSHS